MPNDSISAPKSNLEPIPYTPPEHPPQTKNGITRRGLLTSTSILFAGVAAASLIKLEPTLRSNFTDSAIEILNGDEFIASRPDELGFVEPLSEKEVFAIYSEVAPDNMGLAEFTLLINGLSNCAVCLRGDTKPREAYMGDLTKMCTSIQKLAAMHGVDYGACLSMFLISGRNSSYGAFAGEVESEKIRRAARKVYTLNPELAVNLLYKKSKEGNINPYFSGRIFSGVTLGIHDMEIARIAEAINSDPKMAQKFAISFPQEYSQMQKVLSSRESLEEVKRNYLEESKKILENDQHLQWGLLSDGVLLNLLTNSETGEIDKNQFFKSTFLWAEVFRLNPPLPNEWPGFPSTAVQQKAVQNAIEYYKQNPHKLFSDQMENPRFKKLLIANLQKYPKLQKIINLLELEQKAAFEVIKVESEAEEVIAKRDVDPSFQVVTGVSFAAYQIKQARIGYANVAEELNITASGLPEDSKLYLLANAIREISSVYALCARDGVSGVDLPYASPGDIYKYFAKAIKPIFLERAGTGFITPPYMHLVDSTLNALFEIFKAEVLSKKTDGLPSKEQFTDLLCSTPPYDSWEVAREQFWMQHVARHTDQKRKFEESRQEEEKST